MEAKYKAKEIFNRIRFTSGENMNCSVCDCVVKPIALYMVSEILKQWEYVDTHIADLGGKLSPNYKYWLEVEQEINQL